MLSFRQFGQSQGILISSIIVIGVGWFANTSLKSAEFVTSCNTGPSESLDVKVFGLVIGVGIGVGVLFRYRLLFNQYGYYNTVI